MTEQDLEFDKWYREQDFRRLARIGEFRNYGRTSGGGESAKPVLLFLLAVFVFALGTGTDFFTSLMAVPVLAVIGIVVLFLFGALTGGMGFVALIILAVLSLFA